MKNLLRNSLLLVFLILVAASQLFAEPADTVVVYEYVYVTDTVWIEPSVVRDTTTFEKLKPIVDATLIVDSVTSEANLMFYSEEKTATIPINHIILSENNQKLESMKKITLLGLTLLAVNSSLFAQNQPERSIGIHLRANSVFQQRIYPEIDWYRYTSVGPVSKFEVTPSLGIKGNFPISSSLSLSPRINYLQTYGLENDHYIGVKEVNGIQQSGIVLGDAPTALIQNGYETIYELYTESPTSKFHFLSTDILLNYYFLNGEKIDGRIYGGVRVDCLLTQTQDSIITWPINTAFENVIFNYVGGFGLDFKKRVYLEFEYARNINSFVNTSSLKVNYSTLSLNLGYYLFRY